MNINKEFLDLKEFKRLEKKLKKTLILLKIIKYIQKNCLKSKNMIYAILVKLMVLSLNFIMPFLSFIFILLLIFKFNLKEDKEINHHKILKERFVKGELSLQEYEKAINKLNEI